MPEKIVFSQRAFLSLVCEVAEHPNTETGGLFLGYRNDDSWYVIETIDPGPMAIRQPAYFEYDKPYAEHLLNKQARLYKDTPAVLGLWHRHPSSFDRFSNTDDLTNAKFAEQCGPEIISALVNIDPEFRLTVYLAKMPLSYKKVDYCVEDSPCEGSIFKSSRAIIDDLAIKCVVSDDTDCHHGASILSDIKRALEKCADVQELDNRTDEGSTPKVQLLPDQCVEELLEIIETDLESLCSEGIIPSLSVQNEQELCIDLRLSDSEEIVEKMLLKKTGDKVRIVFANIEKEYRKGLLDDIIRHHSKGK